MHIANGMSSEIVLRNTPNAPYSRGVSFMTGYCWLHDANYKIVQGDETCPRCDKWQAQDLTWRDAEDAHYTSGDDTGDSDEE